jgi:hypothetical protein
LRAVFPKARFVMTHRHPRQVIPSTASLHFTGFCRLIDAAHLDKHEIGRHGLEHWRVAMQRALDYRRRNPEEDIFDLFHGSFNEDPMGNFSAPTTGWGSSWCPDPPQRAADRVARAAYLRQ